MDEWVEFSTFSQDPTYPGAISVVFNIRTQVSVAQSVNKGPYLIFLNTWFLQSNWHAQVPPRIAFLPKYLTKQVFSGQGLVSLYICIGDLHARAWLGNLGNDAEDL